MRGFHVVEASDQLNFGQGGITLPLDRLRTRNTSGNLHVIRLFVAITGAVLAPPPVDSALDEVFFADLVQQVSMRASTASPIAALKADATIIQLQSGYSAFTTLSEAIGDQTVGQKASQRVGATPGVFPFNPPIPSIKSAIGSIVRKGQYGRLCQKGPLGIALAAGGPIQLPPFAYNLPIGIRPGEDSAMNVLPASWLTGKGSAGGSCDGADVGNVFVRMRASSHGIPVDFSGAKFQVWAQVIALGDSMHAPLLLQVLQSTPTTNSIDFPLGLSGFHGFVEELDEPTGDMRQPNFAGVTSLTATVDATSLWTPDTLTEELFGNGSQLLGYDTELYSFGVFQPVIDTRGPVQGLSGPNNALRDLVPGRIILCHRGPSSRSHTFASDKCTGRLRVKLEGSPAAVSRQILSGVWLQNTDAYAEACAKWAGTTPDKAVLQTPLGALSPKAVLGGLQSGIPMVYPAERCG